MTTTELLNVVAAVAELRAEVAKMLVRVERLERDRP
jgi:hypothetical protein